MWYVIQVNKGREDLMAALIARVVPERVLTECFSPKYATEMKVRGRWIPVERDLLPGYLTAVTDEPEELERQLVAMPEFARVLSMGDAYVPLAKDEVELIGGFTKQGSRTVPMSRGIKDGDAVVVTAGPLVGREGMIKSINRRKSTAYLEVNLCGRKISTRVGLAVLTAPGSADAKRAALYTAEALRSA